MAKDNDQKKLEGNEEGQPGTPPGPEGEEGQAAVSWPVVGWINESQSGKAYLVWDGEGDTGKLLGSVNKKTLWKLLQGEVRGAPIKAPRPE